MPKHTVAGRALVVLVSIMTFLASLTIGAVVLVRAAANDWQAEVASELTVQIRPVGAGDIEADVNAAVAILRATPGIAEARAFSRQESARLLEPWLGENLMLEDVPLPRLVVARVAAGASPDLSRLRNILSERIAAAALDDHRGWIERMRAVSGTAVAAGFVLLTLMLAVTILAIGFATRGAMEANRPIIEVLHFIGARNRFVAGRFQRRFLTLGLQGAAVGGGAAILLFSAAEGIASWSATAAADPWTALFGGFSLGVPGYAGILGLILLIAAVTALTSRYTVNRSLNRDE